MSNERITKELDLIFVGKNPHVAVQMLYELSILQHSSKIPPTCAGRDTSLTSRIELCDPAIKQQKAFMSLKCVQVLHYIHELLLKDPTLFGRALQLPDKGDLYYLGLILPYIGHKHTQKGKTLNVYEYIINDGLKVCVWPNLMINRNLMHL